MTENEISKLIVHTSLQIHKELGPGLLESVYEEVLAHELRQNGLAVSRQVAVPVYYRDLKMELGFRADLIVNGKVLVEIKSVKKLTDLHKKQVHTYLKLTGLKLGILLNFNEVLIKTGIKRVVNGL